MKGNVFFVSGIDTNIGKTFATGMIAKALSAQGKTVITQKMVQTGNTTISEDIEMHRRLQGIPLTADDLDGTTCPYIFTYPCSPHMAAAKDGISIDTTVIAAATRKLQEKYEIVLLEGVGGLLVPINDEITTLDYIRACGYPVLLVTSGRLGSINHTLLSLQACAQHGIDVKSVIFNLYTPDDALIRTNTISYLSSYLKKNHPQTSLKLLPEWKANKEIVFQFSL